MHCFYQFKSKAFLNEYGFCTLFRKNTTVWT